MHAPINTGALGHLAGPGFGGYPPTVYSGMGAAVPNLTSAQQLDANCKAKWFAGKYAACSPDVGIWDYMVSFFSGPVSEECAYANSGYSSCIMGQVIAQQSQGAAPAGPVGTGSPADQQAEYGSADARAQQAQQQWLDATTGPPPADPTTDGPPWGWIAAGAAAIVLLRRL